jgi:hypothetical protein
VSTIDEQGLGVNASMQRLCAWAAPACTLFFFGGFLISGYLFPPDPMRSPEATAAFYAENTASIKTGLVLMCFAGGLWIIWSAAMSVQMMRIEGRYPVLAVAQIGLATCACIEFIQPVYMWLTAAYRPRSPEMQQMLNDMGWLPFDGWVWTIIWQNAVIGLAVILDRRSRPVFPRWYGYLCFWAALFYLPAGTNVFFMDGPIAWNGLISWWLLIIDIFAWVMLTFVLLLKAVRRQEAEDDGTATGDVVARLVALERQVGTGAGQL